VRCATIRTLWCWGKNESGQLGLGFTSAKRRAAGKSSSASLRAPRRRAPISSRESCFSICSTVLSHTNAGDGRGYPLEPTQPRRLLNRRGTQNCVMNFQASGAFQLIDSPGSTGSQP
jgi:hypothetical protein